MSNQGRGIHSIFCKNEIIGNVDAHMQPVAVGADQGDEVAEPGCVSDGSVFLMQDLADDCGIKKTHVGRSLKKFKEVQKQSSLLTCGSFHASGKVLRRKRAKGGKKKPTPMVAPLSPPALARIRAWPTFSRYRFCTSI